MAGGSEYNGRQDPGKSVPVLPRPLTDPRQQIRAQNLTGDATGMSPTDDLNFWHGGDWYEGVRVQAEVDAHFAFEDIIDEQWG